MFPFDVAVVRRIEEMSERSRILVLASHSLETLRQMVAGGMGLTLLPALALRGTEGAGTDGAGPVAAVPFAAPAPSRRMALVFREGHPRAPDYERIAEFIHLWRCSWARLGCR